MLWVTCQWTWCSFLKSTQDMLVACERTVVVKEEAGTAWATDGAIPDTGGSFQHGDPVEVLCCWVVILFCQHTDASDELCRLVPVHTLSAH